MNMRREGLFVVSALASALTSGLALGQDLNVSITLEDASQSRAAAADLALPIEQEQPPSPAPPEQERRFEPADFARPNLLESVQIAASDLPRGTTVAAVRCQAFIARDGKLGEHYCTSDDSRAYGRVVTAVIDAVPMQRFVAARVDRASVRVLMNFAVYVDCSSGSCIAIAARNHGYHIERLGLDYVDPQPILEGDVWYEGFDYKLRSARERNYTRGAGDEVPYVMAVEVDASGLAGAGCLVWAVPARPVPGMPGLGRRVAPQQTARTKLYLEKAIGSLGNVRYVPGMIDGRAAALTLYEQSVTRFDLGSNSTALLSLGDIECEASSPR
jgi:hypothetical protein